MLQELLLGKLTWADIPFRKSVCHGRRGIYGDCFSRYFITDYVYA
jgi:hypothetical protein